MNLRLFLRCAIAFGLLGLLSGCEELETAQQTAANAVSAVFPPSTPHGYWNGDGVSGSSKIVVTSVSSALISTKAKGSSANQPSRRANQDSPRRPAITTSSR